MPSKSAHRTQLSIANSLLKGLGQALTNALEKGERRGKAITIDQEVACVGAVIVGCLARRGLCPQPYAGSAIEKLIASLMRTLCPQLSSPHIDTTGFSVACTSACLDSFAKLLGSCPVIEAELKKIIESQPPEVFDNPLLAGWVFQCHASNLSGASRRPKQSSQTALGDIINLTQWFTPDWISDFLVNETVGEATKSSSRFLDPACGAGHILVPALDAMYRHDSNLERCLAEQLFGLDIDPLMLQLSSTALYLRCRDIAGGVDLPTPRLFSILPVDTKYPAECGSLLLGVDAPLVELQLNPLNGTEFIRGKGRDKSEFLPERFSAIAANPPYLSHRLLPSGITAFLNEHYPNSCYDLYAAFIELSLRLLEPGGRFSMICQQSFLTIQRYRELRRELLKVASVKDLVMLGAGSFAIRAGEKVNNAIVVIQREADGGSTHKGETERRTVRYWRLLGTEEKLDAETRGIIAIPSQSVSDSDMRMVSASIQGGPIAPWCPTAIAQLFQTLPALGDKSTKVQCVNGLFTCSNDKFVRHHKEVSEAERHFYVPYDKGGGHKWYRQTPYLLRWEENGKSIREFRASRGQSTRLPGEDMYFKAGLTYSYIGTKDFKARVLSRGSIFDIASSAVFSEEVDLYYVLGFLNSVLVRYMLSILNPTVNFQVGDLRRLPFAKPDKACEARVSEISRTAVALAVEVDAFDSDSPNYIGPRLKPFLEQGFVDVNDSMIRAAYEKLTQRIRLINSKEREYQEEIDDLIFELYRIDEETRRRVAGDLVFNRDKDGIATVPPYDFCLNELRA